MPRLLGIQSSQIYELDPLSKNKVVSDRRRTFAPHTQGFTGGACIPTHMCRCEYEVGCCDCVTIRVWKQL